ncbi:hypothetical protein TRIATDRAFT_256036 [Trichoderma atroviride IMI 206040]|uniref:Uncharacterized protein n=1 Tax=Hypocrea atroviridis (strain ATCC 20476 / IMI 206040) TaxID=452589 RepID=G9NNR0_HYPAI|nr:uncharacterized protein TRIATDRAFT_298709 [Trichoderma atroviride IMI 206040]EHK47700.1 hypothetical protein TRIATDRAFT_256036 [Trichoderma atroviride IMI 206040]
MRGCSKVSGRAGDDKTLKFNKITNALFSVLLFFYKPGTHPKLPIFFVLLLLLLSTKHIIVQLLKAHAPFFVIIYGLRWLPACYAHKTH